MQKQQDYLSVYGARAHNLKNIDVNIPRNKLVVITGVSGSGKSSLAFDTIYAEGQRRYMETFSAYARQFIGQMERPEVEQITGLSPVIAIEQKTTSRNPRSTVGTVTEIYDFLRLLYARASDAYSAATGKKMRRYSEGQILEHIYQHFYGKKGILLAPLIRGRKGHYRELFEQMRKQGYTKVRVDGEILELSPSMQVDRYKTHDIELVIDRLLIHHDRKERVQASLATALRMGKGFVQFLLHGSNKMEQYSKHLMCPESGVSYEEPSPNNFSFNSPYGACPTCKGLGEIHEVDLDKVFPDKSLSINDGGIAALGELRDNLNFRQLRKIAQHYKFTFASRISELPQDALDAILYGTKEDLSKGKKAEDWGYNLVKHGLVAMIKHYYEESSSEKIRRWAEDFMRLDSCPSCKGARLKEESLQFKLDGLHIGQLGQMDLGELSEWVAVLPQKLSDRQLLIAQEVIKEISLRLSFLLDVGLDYLQLNRPARSLSGGESQRIRLATQIGSQLRGITYILDEPSIGLHQRDNQRLIEALRSLANIGNTVLVVEHDRDIMLAADYIIDLGPKAGKQGGELVAEGNPTEFMKQGKSITAGYLSGYTEIALPEKRREGSGKKLSLYGAKGNNLKNIDLQLPLGTFICITGVSGSGKSTLINDTLYPILRQEFHRSLQPPLSYERIEGMEHLDKVIEIDQEPIGRSPRSNPATYIAVFDDIRKLYAALPEAKIRGYKSGRFSFNVKGGRCETCAGSGKRVIEMQFLPNVEVECETCSGRRYNPETLEILYKGKAIDEVLNMTVDEALEFFEAYPKIARKMQTLQEVGLGYISLGQSATTLSGGEAQRIKLAKELSKRDTGSTLYILDEPTTGLHFADIKMLLLVLQSLVDKGNTVLIIEHNMDVIKVADHLVDIGPEAGRNGGQIIAQGSPEALAEQEALSQTGKYLKIELNRQLAEQQEK